jgi:ABC-type oligopeptide transport system substrate-binding subunit
MKKHTLFLTGMLAVALVLGLVLAGCEDATNSSGNNTPNVETFANPFTGTSWSKSSGTPTIDISFDNSTTYSLYVEPSFDGKFEGQTDNGPYLMSATNTAFLSSGGTVTIATATATQMSFVRDGKTYTLTKK